MAKMKDAKPQATICGVTKKEIREAYFSGKLNDLLAKVQWAQEWSDNDIALLGAELTVLEKEGKAFVGTLRDTFTGAITGLETDTKPPSVEELTEGVSDADWRDKADKAGAYISENLASVRKAISEKAKIAPSYWLDQAAVFLSMRDILDRDRVFQEQKYRARLTNIIDDFHVSRKEAEERARLTKEYSDYKNADLLLERINEFVMLAKKKDAEGRAY